MITGTYNDRVHLKGLGQLALDNAVACIKEIRMWSGLGLKESKDMYDRLRNRHFDSSPSTEYVKVKHEDYHKAVAGLRNVGFTV
jgi:ribosomal protein L7/L12